MPTQEEIIEALKKVIDPELYIDVWTLGLIYSINQDDSVVAVKMTFTSIACPAGPQLVDQVRQAILELPGVDKVDVEVVFQPPWEPSEELKALMGIG